MPATAAPPATCLHRTPSGSRPNRTAPPRKQASGDPDQLPHHPGGHDPSEHRDGPRMGRASRCEARSRRWPARTAGGPRRRRSAPPAARGARPARHRGRRPPDRHQHAHHHAGQRRLHSPGGQQHPEPDPPTRTGHADAASTGGRTSSAVDDERHRQSAVHGSDGVEDGQHQHRADVVGHGQREQDEPEPGGHPAPEQGQGPEGEGDVRGHRDAPARRAPGPPWFTSA